jgi:hypothetical protein
MESAKDIARDMITGQIIAMLNDLVGIWEFLESGLQEGEWERMSLRQQEALVVDVEHWLRHYKEEWEK